MTRFPSLLLEHGQPIEMIRLLIHVVGRKPVTDEDGFRQLAEEAVLGVLSARNGFGLPTRRSSATMSTAR